MTAYLYRVALNGFRMQARRARVAARQALPVVAAPDAFDDIELREDLRRLLLGLTPRQRSASVLTDVLG